MLRCCERGRWWRIGRFADFRLLLPVVVALVSFGTPSSAAPLGGLVDPYRLCTDAIARQERSGQTPRHLLTAIAIAESGRRHPVTKAAVPWPWAVMAEGRGRYLDSKAEAIAEVQGLLARGIRNIDVGCMQINLSYHPNAFASLDEAFDPAVNVAYAADYLRSLYIEEGSWQEAAGRYHSATPQYKIPYQERVLALWDKQQDRALRGSGDLAGDDVLASLPPERRIAMPPLRQRQPTPAMVNEFVRQLQMPTARRGSGAPLVASADRPGPGRLSSLTGTADVTRDAAAAERFAQRRAEYMQAWREGVDAGSGPVTVVRGTAQQVYTVDMR